MTELFAEVLAQETATLARVTDAAGLDRWRRRLIAQVRNPQSAYAEVLRSVSDTPGRAMFLDRWRDLIAATLARLLDAGTVASTEIDNHQMAVSILAALHGGAVLSRISGDPTPLNVTVELALAPMVSTCDAGSGSATRDDSVSTIDM